MSENFRKEFDVLLRDYVGRPSPLYLSEALSQLHGYKVYLKTRDLNHTGAHKINNAIGQILLAKHMGKQRIIAETGAGSKRRCNGHGVRPDEDAVHDLYGGNRRGTPTSERGEDAIARRQGGGC